MGILGDFGRLRRPNGYRKAQNGLFLGAFWEGQNRSKLAEFGGQFYGQKKGNFLASNSRRKALFHFSTTLSVIVGN